MKPLLFSLWVLLAGGGLLLGGCVDPYLPEAISSTKRYLVVDGFINASGVTEIKLSRTYNLQNANTTPERQAVVNIEEEGGPRYRLGEGVAGTYSSSFLTLNPAKNYRLLVTTTGKDYASAFVPVKITPVIDNVSWRTADTGLNIYVDTHDASGNSQYYRWDYEETWETVPVISPELEWVSATRRLQPISNPYPYICWSTEKSSAVSLFRTTALSQDVVADYLLRSQPTNSARLFTKYSILVKQFAMTREEYAYWELLRKNTENIGTLFDPLPSQLTGNIRCLSDEDELALGFVGVQTMTQKRIFVRREQLPRAWPVQHGYEDCLPVSILDLSFISNVSAFLNNLFAPGANRVPVANMPGGLGTTTRECVDCRLRGTDVRPAFWQ